MNWSIFCFCRPLLNCDSLIKIWLQKLTPPNKEETKEKKKGPLRASFVVWVLSLLSLDRSNGSQWVLLIWFVERGPSYKIACMHGPQR